jgi:hypothetical protein
VAVLGAVRPDGENVFGSDLPHPPGLDLPLPTPDVSYTYSTTGPVEFTLGGNPYGQPLPPFGGMNICSYRCVTDVASTYAPGAGTYQLLFGATAIGDTTSALMVTSATTTVPEPATVEMTLFGVAILAVPFARRARGTGCSVRSVDRRARV